MYLRVVLIVPKFAGDEELAPVDAGSGQTGLDPRSDLVAFWVSDNELMGD